MEQEEIDYPVLRNHPTVIIGNIVTSLLVVGFIVLVNLRSIEEGGLVFNIRWVLVGLLILAGLTFIFWRRWKLTTFTFGPTELTVKRDTIFKYEAHIQYSRLASVNVRRNIINHIFDTTQLLFNVNSSVNSNRAEATLTLKSYEADKLREKISSMIFQKEMVMEEETQRESLVKVSNSDIILHGLIGQPSIQSIIGIGTLIYSVATLILGNGTGFIPALIIFVFTSAVPWIRTILRYSNYRIYRVDDTITVESGLINNYRSSFKINKVNSVRIRQPLIARSLGMALLEAEVIGIADSDGMPLLCPLKSKEIVLNLGAAIVPEFMKDFDHHPQPSKALIPTMFYKVILAAGSTILGLVLLILIQSLNPQGLERVVSDIVILVPLIILPILLIVHGILAQKGREFAMGEEIFMFIIGGYDRETDFIRYDKVQMTRVSNGPIQRRFGVSRCTVSLMSSMGAKNITSGVFFTDELERVSDEIMARIRDGRYDYRKYQ